MPCLEQQANTPNMRKKILARTVATATALLTAHFSTNAAKAIEPEPWTNCLYNRSSISCRRIFTCASTPCYQFRLEWRDGIKETYTRVKSGMALNVGFYEDPRGGQWMLRGYAGSFALVNESNKNTIIYDMTLNECQRSELSEYCIN